VVPFLRLKHKVSSSNNCFYIKSTIQLDKYINSNMRSIYSIELYLIFFRGGTEEATLERSATFEDPPLVDVRRQRLAENKPSRKRLPGVEPAFLKKSALIKKVI
jgi:hypothetical protein